MQRIDVTGKRFGQLVVERMVYELRQDSKAACKCDCGGNVVALVYNLRNGNTSSCGCLSRKARSDRGKVLGQLQGKKNIRHGQSKTPAYISWLDARKRCFKKQNKRYEAYGGRGITMSADWAESFEAFYRDMGDRPEGMTLDRIDVNGNYERDNCRWATKGQQAQNTRRTRATWEIVREMRALYETGMNAAELAVKYGMCWSNAKYIVSGVTWKDDAATRERIGHDG